MYGQFKTLGANQGNLPAKRAGEHVFAGELGMANVEKCKHAAKTTLARNRLLRAKLLLARIPRAREKLSPYRHIPLAVEYGARNGIPAHEQILVPVMHVL